MTTTGENSNGRRQQQMATVMTTTAWDGKNICSQAPKTSITYQHVSLGKLLVSHQTHWHLENHIHTLKFLMHIELQWRWILPYSTRPHPAFRGIILDRGVEWLVTSWILWLIPIMTCQSTSGSCKNSLALTNLEWLIKTVVDMFPLSSGWSSFSRISHITFA